MLSRILDTLTLALQSSGMDLSQTRISVQIDVGNQAENGPTSVASSSKVFLESTTELVKAPSF